MKFIHEQTIQDLLGCGCKTRPDAVRTILAKARTLSRLSLKESALLLGVTDPCLCAEIYETASYVKESIYGARVVLFAPLYISNVCQNSCLYCAFKSDNAALTRKTLSVQEINKEVLWLLSRGHKRILMVSAEALGADSVAYYVSAMRAIYSASHGPHRIKRVNVNCAPLSVEGFKRLKSAGIGTYQLFQETYHDKTYRSVHPYGPKSDPDNRIDALQRAFAAGIDDLGIGVLYGLYDYRYETLALLAHIEHMEKIFHVGPHTISVPRIEPACGASFTSAIPYPVSDEEFKRIIAVLRLSVPYTGIILSTRETPRMRDELFRLGVSQISAESNTSAGGYGDADKNVGQFSVGDHRSLDEVIASLLEKGFIPSFCAACYRKERTGEVFMDLARPGQIKGKCSMNALVTLKEYLDDFAPLNTKESGYRLIEEVKATLAESERAQLDSFFKAIDVGVRDEFV